MTEQQIREALISSQRSGATHMLLVVDRADNFKTSAVMVHPHEELDKVVRFYRALHENEVVEVYDLSVPLEIQLQNETPVFTL